MSLEYRIGSKGEVRISEMIKSGSSALYATKAVDLLSIFNADKLDGFRTKNHLLVSSAGRKTPIDEQPNRQEVAFSNCIVDCKEAHKKLY